VSVRRVAAAAGVGVTVANACRQQEKLLFTACLSQLALLGLRARMTTGKWQNTRRPHDDRTSRPGWMSSSQKTLWRRKGDLRRSDTPL